MNKFETTKIEYKITTSVEGFCPHCNHDLASSKIEELEDKYPSEDYWNESHQLFDKIPRRDNDIEFSEYNKHIKNHPVYVNYNNLHNTWRDRIKEMPIKHIIRSETIYVIEGVCPTCSNGIELKHQHSIMMYSPPMMEIGEQMKVRQIHHCPKCDNLIIVEDGIFKQSESVKNENEVFVRQSSIDAIKDIQKMKAYDTRHLNNKDGKNVIDNSKRGWTTGTKRASKHIHKCPICYGKTKVPKSLYFLDTTDSTEEITCKSCNGKGYISDLE